VVTIELRLLATMLYSGDFSPIAQGEITEEHFNTDHGKALCSFVLNYHLETGGRPRWPSLSQVRERMKHLDLPNPDPGDSVEGLAHEMKMDKLRADIRAMSTELELVSKMPAPLSELDKIANRVRKLCEPVQRARHMSLKDAIHGILDEYDLGNVLPSGIPWPWPSLTKATRGMHRKEFYVFAGRPKSRKTFTATEVAVRAFMDHGERVLFFSPEMPPRQVMLRSIAHMARVRYTEFKNGELDKAEVEKLLDVADRFGTVEGEDETAYRFRFRSANPEFQDRLPPSFDVVQSTGKDVMWMQTQIETFQPTIILCDSFYRQEGGKKYDSDWKAVSAVSRRLKDMTMEMNIVTIGTMQMNRGAERQIGDLSNVALADAIGQDADAIFRVVTGKIEGDERSAIVTLGAREVPFDGILINNKPCWDMGEIGVITNMKQVKALMEKEDTEEEDAGPKKGKGVTKKNQPQDGAVKAAARIAAQKTDGIDSWDGIDAAIDGEDDEM